MTRPEPNHPEALLPWLANGTLEGDELRQVEEHLRSCLVCRQELAELRRLRREVKATSKAPPPGASGLERLLADVETERRQDTRRRIRPWRPLLAAAVVAMALGVGMRSAWNPPEVPAEERAGRDADAVRSLVGLEASLSRQAFILRWQAASAWHEARFSVIVTAEDLTLVAEVHGLEATEYQVPAAALAHLPAGARLFWRVEAIRSDGVRWTGVFPIRLE